MTAPTTLAAAREAVAIDTRLSAAATGRPSDWKDSDMADMDRLAALTRQHAHHWAAALLAAEAEGERLRRDRDTRLAERLAPQDGCTTSSPVAALVGSVSIAPLMPYIDHGCVKMPDGSHIWAVSFPGLPNCIAQGGTLAEALANLAEMVPMCIGQIKKTLDEVSAELITIRAALARREPGTTNVSDVSTPLTHGHREHPTAEPEE